MEDKVAMLERALAREKAARKQAEILLEEKSIEIYNTYVEVKRLNKELKSKLEKKSKDAVELAAFPRENPSPVMRFSKQQELLYSNVPGETLLTAIKSEKDEKQYKILISAISVAYENGSTEQCHIQTGSNHLILTITPVQSQGYVNVYGFDQTEIKAFEKALITKQQELDGIVNGGSDMILSIDSNGNVLFCNQVWSTKMEISNEQSLGKSIFQFIEESGVESFIDALRKSGSSKSGIVEGSELTFITKSGTKLVCEANLSAIFENEQHVATTGIFRDLTIRRELEALNRERSLLIASSTDAIMSADDRGTVISWNKGAENLFGYTKSEMVGASISILSQKSSEMIVEQAEVLGRLNEGESVSYETQRMHKNGHTISVHVSVFPIHTGIEGSINHGAIIRDITEKKKAEQALTKSENLLKEAQSIANLAGWEWNLKTGTLSGPENFLSKFNLALPNKIETMDDLLVIVHQDDLEAVRFKLSELNKASCSITVQFRLNVKRSRSAFIEMRANSEFAKGKLNRIYGVLMDKTNQKESEILKEEFTRELETQVKDRTAKLEVSQNELSNQVDTLNQIALVSTIDTEGLITYANDIFCAVSGYTLPELIGKQFADLHSNSQDIASIIGLWGGVEKGEIWKGEVIYKAKRGHDFWLHQTVVPFFNLEGEIEKYVAVSFDVTYEKEMQQQLQTSLIKEKELGELKSHFVAMASHQFRTPLAIIQSNSELLNMIITKESESSLKGKLVRSSERITGEISRMTQLMDDVLILGKIGAGHLEAELREVHLVELLKDIQSRTNETQRDGRSLDLEVTGKMAIVHLDEQLIQHVVENLVSNAFKYSEKENPKVGLNFNKNSVTISVEDKGLGIPEGEREKLFQPFHRADNVANIQGTGLGLVIAKEYTELNGGHIEVESQENVGTKVLVTLPIRQQNNKTELKSESPKVERKEKSELTK
jgi:PAS domain S-box-containing protein